MYAAKWNSVGAMDLLESERDLVDISHNTPLMFAAMNDSCDAIEKLVDK